MSQPVPSFKGNLVGVNFRPKDARERVGRFAINETVMLRRDPANPYDENAVQVISWDKEDQSELHCGFIERGIASSLARWMDEGHIFSARIHSATEDKRSPWLIEIVPTGEQIKTNDPIEEFDNGHPGQGTDYDIPF